MPQVRAFKPDGEDSYDMTAYQDADGSAYLVRSVGNVFLGISALTSDYLDTTGICSAGPRARHPTPYPSPHCQERLPCSELARLSTRK